MNPTLIKYSCSSAHDPNLKKWLRKISRSIDEWLF